MTEEELINIANQRREEGSPYQQDHNDQITIINIMWRYGIFVDLMPEIIESLRACLGDPYEDTFYMLAEIGSETSLQTSRLVYSLMRNEQ